MRIAKDGGEILPGDQQVAKHLNILRIGALIVGQEHAAAKIGALGEGEHRQYVGLLGGESVGSIGSGLVKIDVVGGQAIELGLRGCHLQRAVSNIASELECEVSDLVVEHTDLGPRGIVLVHADEPILEQRVLKIVAGGWVVGGQGNGSQRGVNLGVQA